jgi:hypothetical protein
MNQDSFQTIQHPEKPHTARRMPNACPAMIAGSNDRSDIAWDFITL